MRRLTLDVEMLQVESFDTAPVAVARGTVLGHAAPAPVDSAEGCVETVDEGCSAGTICFYSCGGTCGASPPVTLYELDCETGAALAAVAPFPYDCV